MLQKRAGIRGHFGRCWYGWQTVGSALDEKLVSQCREQPRRVYYGAVLRQKEIAGKILSKSVRIQESQMNDSRALRSLCFAVTLIMVLPGLLAAQSQPTRGTIDVPFDFYISGEKLPAGQYTLDRIIPTYVTLRSKDGKVQQDLYFIQTSAPVKNPPLKVIFALRDGKYYFAEVWSWYGKSQLSSFTSSASDQAKDVPLKAAE